MRILIVHNRYQLRGGEDIVFEAERVLLEGAGHDVSIYERHNKEILGYSLLQRVNLFRRVVWAEDSVAAIRQILNRRQPEIVCVYNTFPLISPAVYSVCDAAHLPVVQTLSNYRLICPGSQLRRNAAPCEDCVGRNIPWPSVIHGCYRDSAVQTAAVSGMLLFHRLMNTWSSKIHTYIALTEFARQKFIEGGLPGEKIVVKPNFVRDPGPRQKDSGYALFVGRLSNEKGVSALLEAWTHLPDIPLKVAGDGPLMETARKTAEARGSVTIEFLGWQTRSEVIDLMSRARFLVFPTECYEGFPLTLVEAMACGLPVLGSRIGSVQEIVHDGETGLLFEPGNAADIVSKAQRLWQDGALCRTMGIRARAVFEAQYTAERNYQLMMELFENAIAGKN